VLDGLPWSPAKQDAFISQVSWAYTGWPRSPGTVNDDHADDSLLIVRTFGGQLAAMAARMSGMDADARPWSAAARSRCGYRSAAGWRRAVRCGPRPCACIGALGATARSVAEGTGDDGNGCRGK
jgi:hypothetical protein